MTIKESLTDYLGESAKGETIAEVLREGLSAEGTTIGAVVADAPVGRPPLNPWPSGDDAIFKAGSESGKEEATR